MGKSATETKSLSRELSTVFLLSLRFASAFFNRELPWSIRTRPIARRASMFERTPQPMRTLSTFVSLFLLLFGTKDIPTRHHRTSDLTPVCHNETTDVATPCSVDIQNDYVPTKEARRGSFIAFVNLIDFSYRFLFFLSSACHDEQFDSVYITTLMKAGEAKGRSECGAGG